MIITEKLTKFVSQAFEICGYSFEYGKVTVSDRLDLCQFQCSGALSASKFYKKNPFEIAEKVVEVLQVNKEFFLAEAIRPGFINLKLTDVFIGNLLNKMNSDQRLLLPIHESKTIVLDFGGANVAKPLHVGHMRSADIGGAMCRIAKFLGHNVISDAHLGDWGMQMGLTIAEIELLDPLLPYFDPDFTGEYPAEPPFCFEDLNNIYPNASARSKIDKDFAEKAARITVEFQDGRRGYRALADHIRRVSVNGLKYDYDRLKADFNYWYGESDADPYIPKVIDLLKEKGLLYESDGAMVVDVEKPDDKEPMPPIIITKSNGGDMYGTTDLGTLYQRVEDWNPDEVWYFTDNRQILHFKQVFRCAELAGIIQAEKCVHIGFGTMNGKDGKPYKTRDGGVTSLSDLIKEVIENAYRITDKNGFEVSEEKRRETAEMVGIAALKIGDLINYRGKDFIFDPDKFLASEGKTGPYLQYSAVRLKSVIDKAKELNIQYGEIKAPETDFEREAALALLSVSQRLNKAFDEKAPNYICDTLFDITGALNRLYNGERVLANPDESRRNALLTLFDLGYRMIFTLLSLLGIEVPESM